MKKFILLMYCIFFVLQIQGQISYFEKYNNFGDGGEGIKNLIKINETEGLILSTGEVSDVDEGWHMIIRKINLIDGSVIFKKDFSPELNYGLEPTGVFQNEAGNFMITGLVKDAIDTSYPFNGNVFLCEMNAEGDILWSNSIGSYPIREWGYDIAQVDDGGYIIVGKKDRHIDTNTQDAFIVKTNAQGDSLWTTTFADEGGGRWSSNMALRGPDNTCYIGINKKYDSEPWFELVRLDATDGSIIWRKEHVFGAFNVISDGVLSQSNEFILSASFIPEVGCGQWLLMKINPDGSIKWQQTHEEDMECSSGQRTIRTNEGGYAVCFRNGYPTLAVTDSKGNFLYSKVYDLEPLMGVKNLIQLEDGSFIIAGSEGATSDYTGWLIRTDPEGNLVVSVGQEIEKIPVSIYPNPSTDYINIDLPENSIETYTARLANSAGVLVATYNHTQLNSPISIESFPSGMYYVNIFEESQLVAIKKIIKP